MSNVDAFAGMMAEKHVSGSELGELRLAIWKDQFGAARDADRFFYQNDPLQSYVRNTFGIDSRKTLAQVIAMNTDVPSTALPANVFRIPGAPNVAPGTSVTGGSTLPGSAASTMADQSAVAAPPAPSYLTRHQGKAAAGTGNAKAPASVAGYPGARTLRRRRRSSTRSPD